jgi:hypothetical protein
LAQKPSGLPPDAAGAEARGRRIAISAPMIATKLRALMAKHQASEM